MKLNHLIYTLMLGTALGTSSCSGWIWNLQRPSHPPFSDKVKWNNC